MKKMKAVRWFGAVTAMACVFQFGMTAHGSAAEKFSNVSDLQQDVSVSGGYATLRLDDWNGRSGKIRLIAVSVNQKTGEIEDIKKDEKDGSANGALDFSIDLRSMKKSADAEIVYYLWGEDQTSQVNSRPSGVTAYTTESRITENKIMWTAPEDDGGAIAAYRIYDQNDRFLYETEDCYYIDGRSRAIEAGTEYTYKVRAVDANGNESDAKESTQVKAKTAAHDHWKEGNANGVEPIILTDVKREAYVEVTQKNGVTCILAPSSRSLRDGQAFYSATFVASNMESTKPYDHVYVTVRYLDTDGGEIALQYKYLDGTTVRTKTVKGPRLSNTNQWKTYTFDLSSSVYMLRNTGSISNGHFCLHIDKGYDFYVAEVKVAGANYRFAANPSLGSVTDLQAEGSAKTVTLSWDAPAAAGDLIAKYHIYDQETGLLLGESKDRTFTDGMNRTLESETSYTYRVVPVDANGQEGEATEQSKISATTKSMDMQNLKAQTVEGKIKLTWDAYDPSGEYSTYRIYDAQTGTRLAETDALFYIDTRSLTAGTQYRYKVVPINSAGQEAPVTEASQVSAYAPYDEVGELSAEAKVQEIKLTWTAVQDTARYTKYRVYDQGDGTRLAETTECSFIDGRDRALAPNTEYTYKVVPVDASGVEAPTSEASVIKKKTLWCHTWSAETYFTEGKDYKQGIMIQNYQPQNDSYFTQKTVSGKVAAYVDSQNGEAINSYRRLFFYLLDQNGNTVDHTTKKDYSITVVYSGTEQPDNGTLKFGYKTDPVNNIVWGTEVGAVDQTAWKTVTFDIKDAYTVVKTGQNSNSYFSIGNSGTESLRFALAELRVAETKDLKFTDSNTPANGE